MSDGGKGSTQRPRSIADEEWANRWDAIFGRDSDKAKQQRALDALIANSQELGGYDDEVVKPNATNM